MASFKRDDLVQLKRCCMRNNIKLSIPEPCHENWANMTPTEKGKFCGACQKQVIDFTGLSDTELAAFFIKHKNTAVCGRMHTQQINKPLPVPTPKKKILPYLLGIGLPALLLSCNNELQGKVLVGEIDMVTAPTPDTIVSNMTTPPKTRTITGKVTGADGMGIPQVLVTIKNTDYSAITNEKGEYTIIYGGSNNKPVIEISQWGYLPFSKKISIKAKNNAVASIPVCLKPDDQSPREIIMGLVAPAPVKNKRQVFM